MEALDDESQVEKIGLKKAVEAILVAAKRRSGKKVN